jgi:cytochrome c oxidase accessory protein FixG
MSHIGKPREQDQGPDNSGQGPLYADRVRIYPMAVHGRMRQIKWAVLIFCLVVYYALPWLRWNRGLDEPTQAVLLDLGHRRFYLFGLELWPQDAIFLAGLLIIAAVTLFFVTSLVGRVWCGYSCPQTVWTDLFMWIERTIEGDRNARIKRDAQPISFDKVWRKAAKHTIWLGIAFWTGGAWIMYYVDAPTVTRDFWLGTADGPVYVFTLLFTATTYVLAGWAREQVCTYMCPWPRFQSAMMDEHSYTVTYQAWRGEPRTRGKHIPDGSNVGDCVDCSACVAACPTGIDIRDGIQLECIDCGLCMDACDHVMNKLGRKPALITWDTLSRQAAKKVGKKAPVKLLRSRSIIYIVALVVALSGMGIGLATRSTLSISIQRDRAPLFVTLPSGEIRNGYLLHVLNKTPKPSGFTLEVEHLDGARIAVAETATKPGESVTIQVKADEVATFRILVTATPLELSNGSQPVNFVLRSTSDGAQTHYSSVFMGPAGFRPPGAE